MDNISKTEILRKNLEKLDKKEFNILFYSPDTQGMANGTTNEIYRQVKTLCDLGYNAVVVHDYEGEMYNRQEQEDAGVKEFDFTAHWVEDEFKGIPHYDIRDTKQVGDLKISMSDFLVIPESCTWLMEDTFKRNFPCEKIVLLNSVDIALHGLMVGMEYNTWQISNIITMSGESKKWIEETMQDKYDVQVITPEVPYFFKPYDKPKNVTIGVYTKNFNDFNNKVLKPFYLKYKNLNFVHFKPLAHMKRETFAEELSKCMTAVWIDRITGFGTFPLECMATQTVPVALLPDMRHEYIKLSETEFNAAWSDNPSKLVDMLYEVITHSMTRTLNDSIYENMTNTVKEYYPDKSRPKVKEVFEYFIEKRKKALQETLVFEEKNDNK